jgi:hypothetical protein
MYICIHTNLGTVCGIWNSQKVLRAGFVCICDSLLVCAIYQYVLVYEYMLVYMYADVCIDIYTHTNLGTVCGIWSSQKVLRAGFVCVCDSLLECAMCYVPSNTILIGLPDSGESDFLDS